MAQVNHYLAVSGFDCWYIAALIFGKELVIHKITTDKEVLNNLIAKEEHFWKYNVMPEIPPVPTGSEGIHSRSISYTLQMIETKLPI